MGSEKSAEGKLPVNVRIPRARELNHNQIPEIDILGTAGGLENFNVQPAACWLFPSPLLQILPRATVLASRMSNPGSYSPQTQAKTEYEFPSLQSDTVRLRDSKAAKRGAARIVDDLEQLLDILPPSNVKYNLLQGARR